ncbi:MAG: hypothetical protein JOY94_12105 [Methylobacteriaceae bacterium]|nr:hypothetical protein [Methylobacteriaceae bacterium]
MNAGVKKVVAAGIAALTLAGGMGLASTPASADWRNHGWYKWGGHYGYGYRYGWYPRRHWVGPVGLAAGILGGLAYGAFGPGYYGPYYGPGPYYGYYDW